MRLATRRFSLAPGCRAGSEFGRRIRSGLLRVSSTLSLVVLFSVRVVILSEEAGGCSVFVEALP